jgi:penicillin amidase
MNRLLGVVNTIIGLAVIALLGAAYWYFWRPLPEVSGNLPAPVSAATSIARDALGVPHIRAANQDDLLFAQGYATAADRLWQMDSLRRFSAGDLSEVVGPVGLAADRDSRRLRIRRVAEEIYPRLAPQDRAAFAAYVRGVNYYIATHHGRYSFEFAALGYDPMPWSTVDSILIGLYMYRSLTSTWEAEIHKRSMLQVARDPAKVQLLWPVRGGLEIPPGSDVSPGGDVQEGSNGWAVSGAHTASGKPLLSNDMHLQWSIPGIWYMAQLEMPGMNVMGVTLPGVPGVISGHNERMAWGLTNVGFDVQDLYVEKLDVRTGRYQFRDHVEQARLEREMIRIKGKPPEPFQRWVTRHGPVFIEDENEKMTLRWTAAEPGLFAFPFLDINRARNWDDFTRALSNYPGPAQNFVYADVDGNIGFHVAGKLPVRRNYYGDIPVDGSSGDFEWDGYIPFDQLPNSYNPPNGYIVTANQNSFPRDYPYHVNGNFPSEYRARQILDMLRAKQGLKPDDMLRIQKDVYSAFAHFLASQIVQATDKRKATNPNFNDAIPLLRKWDGQMDKGEAAPMIVALAYQYLRKFIGDSAAPGKGSIYDLEISSAVVRNLLLKRPTGWFDNWDVTLERALADGIDEGRRMQGDSLAKWRYGRFLEVQITHPIGHQIPIIGKYFDIGSVEMSGTSTSVKQTTKRVGPSMRMNADLSDWDSSLLNIPIGQSGHPLSRHYKDEWDAYYNGTSFPMQFRKVDVKDTLTLEPDNRK